MHAARRVVVLTGAGVSTESGIPDYRSPAALAKQRRPIQGPEFVRSAKLRQRYWARAMVGWERFRLAEPNASHHALAKLESLGVVRGVITQNVDRLHHKAGSKRVIELHGALEEVICLDCGYLDERDPVQARMRALNPNWIDGAAPMAPDGDAELPVDLVEKFVVADCDRCHGTIKPNVVFFGHNVERSVVDAAFALLDEADLLLVAGTSLTVFSGYRFLLRARDRGTPIVIINRGPVRGEEHAALRIDGSTGEVLSDVATSLARSSAPVPEQALA